MDENYRAFIIVIGILLFLGIVSKNIVFIGLDLFLFLFYMVILKSKGKIYFKHINSILNNLRIKNNKYLEKNIIVKDGIIKYDNKVKGVLIVDDIPFDYRDMSDESLRNKIISFHKVLDVIGDIDIVFKKQTIDKNNFLENLFLKAQNLRVIVEADPSNERAKNELEMIQFMIKKITEGESPFRYVIYFIINSSSEENAFASMQLLKKGLESIGIKSRLANKKEIENIFEEKLKIRSQAFPTQIPFLTVFSLQKSPRFEFFEDGIYIGKEIGNGRAVFWNYNNMLNPHVLLIGPTGSGKTEFLISLGYKINTYSKIPIVYFDTKSDIKIRFKKYGIKFKLLNPLVYGLGLLNLDKNVDLEAYISQLEEILSQSFRLDKYTSSMLYKVIKEVFSKYTTPSWDQILEEIEKLEVSYQVKTYLTKIISQVREYEGNYYGKSIVDTIEDENIYIIDFSLIKSEEIRRLILLSVIMKIYNRYNIADDILKIGLVIDEAWTILKESSEYSIIIDLIKRGRGFGIMLLMATQNIIDLGGLSEIYLQNIGLLVFMNNGDKKFWQEVSRFVNLTDKEIINELSFLGKGEALIRFITDPRPIVLQLDTLIRDSL